MQSYVINLAARPERMDFMRRQLAKLKIAYARIDAVDGLADTKIYPGVSGLKLSGVEYACYLSHLKAYDAFLKTDAPLALVLEDDMVLSDTFTDALAFAASTHRRGSLTRLEIPIQSITGEPTRIAAHPASRAGKWSLWQLKSCVYGMGAYIIDRELAQDILANYGTPQLQIDMMLLCDNQLIQARPEIFQVSPPVAIQNRYQKEDEKADINDSDLEEIRAALVAEHIRENNASFKASVASANPVVRHLRNRQRNFIINTTAIYQRFFKPVVIRVKGIFVKQAVFRMDRETRILSASELEKRERPGRNI